MPTKKRTLPPAFLKNIEKRKAASAAAKKPAPKKGK